MSAISAVRQRICPPFDMQPHESDPVRGAHASRVPRALPGPGRSIVSSCVLAVLFTTAVSAAPVELRFTVPSTDAAPFARELWADVTRPGGDVARLPAFFIGEGEYAVRAHPGDVGDYTLAGVLETTGVGIHALDTSIATRGAFHVDSPAALPAIGIDPEDSRRFRDSTGAAYVPIGANLPWTLGPDAVGYFRKRFEEFEAAGLNWTRIWMCHWGGLNLDWLRGDDTIQPAPGTIDAAVAARWDAIVELAEAHGIRVQMVLQHHGQYSTGVNPNWNTNPWNAALPGGFLKTPGEFFSSEKARQLTRQKYRYITARWGYSNAILAWELFNEVHWVDAFRLERDEKLVAQWHDEMAAWLRGVDPHRRFVTTSTDDLRSPIYASMDYLQPHLYASDMIAAARLLDMPAGRGKLPVFFGEIGDDHLALSEEEKKLSRGTIPPVWSGIMGAALLPPQIWYGERLIESGRFHELEAVASFLRETRLATRTLATFSPAIESDETIPLVIRPASRWRPVASDAIEIPADGGEPPELGRLPAFLVTGENSRNSGFPGAATLRIAYPHSGDARVVLGGAAPAGATAAVLLDGREVARHTWPAREASAPAGEVSIPLPLSAGAHEITLRNIGEADWFEFSRFETGLQTPALAAVGKRAADFIALWIWNREHIHSVDTGPGARATLLLADVAAGEWKVSWWDTIHGSIASTKTLSHAGGVLRLDTPEIARHAAAVLEKQ